MSNTVAFSFQKYGTWPRQSNRDQFYPYPEKNLKNKQHIKQSSLDTEHPLVHCSDSWKSKNKTLQLSRLTT